MPLYLFLKFKRTLGVHVDSKNATRILRKDDDDFFINIIVNLIL